MTETSRSTLRIIALAVASAAVGALLTIAVTRGGGKSADEAKAAARPERIRVDGDEIVVVLDAATLSASHIAATPLPPSSGGGASMTSFVTVVDVKDLADGRNQYAQAVTASEQARARLAAASAGLQRVKALHDDNRNVSDRALLEAESAERAERAAVEGAAASIRLAADALRQRWGEQIATAVTSDASWARDLIEQRQVLLELATPAVASPPRRIDVRTPDGRSISGSFLSAAPRTDVRLQGRSNFYLAPATGVAPGMTLSASFAGVEPSASGVIVPAAAVVWADGRPWVYVERRAGEFTRTAVTIDHPVAGGFAEASIPPGSRVVTIGAQALLSEEMRPQMQD
jgi:hypothetical protein